MTLSLFSFVKATRTHLKRLNFSAFSGTLPSKLNSVLVLREYSAKMLDAACDSAFVIDLLLKCPKRFSSPDAFADDIHHHKKVAGTYHHQDYYSIRCSCCNRSFGQPNEIGGHGNKSFPFAVHLSDSSRYAGAVLRTPGH